MNAAAASPPKLEILTRRPKGQAVKSPPLLFVHGGFTGAWCWDEFFLDWFAARGRECHAPSLRGHGESEGLEALHDFGIDDFVEDVARVVDGLDRPPVLIGHSMGTFVIQKYLENRSAAAAILLAPVPASGLAGPGMAMAAVHPKLFWDLGIVHEFGKQAVTPAGMHEVLFAANAAPEVVQRYEGRLSEESHRAWLDMSGFNPLVPSRIGDLPILVLGGKEDTIIAPAFVRSAARLLGTDAEILPGLGHALMLEPGWDRVAARMNDWLDEQGL